MTAGLMTAAGGPGARMPRRPPGPIPAHAGIGLRFPHTQAVLESPPPVGWLEVHSENYFAPGSARAAQLERIRDSFPLSLHGVGLSLGSTDPLDQAHLDNLRRIVRRYEPGLVSEHLSWGSIGGRHFNDLLPLPCTQEALDLLVARVSRVQDHLARPILVENVSSYLQFNCSTYGEPEFLAELARRCGCGLLLDVNNVYVNARNHGFDASDYLARIPSALVGEVHLAGHSRNAVDGREILIDTHSTRVCDEVWNLYAAAIARCRDCPTLIEWDTDLPALDVLVAEARKADHIRERVHAVAA